MPPYSKSYIKMHNKGRYVRRVPKFYKNVVKGDIQRFPRRPHKSEIKTVDTHIGAAFDTGSDLALLNGVAVGANEYNRVGRRIEMQYLRINAIISPVSNQSINQPDYYRVVIVYDRQTNGSAPSFADIMTDTDNAGTSTSFVYSNPNVDNKFRFTILKDVRRYVPPASFLNWQNTGPALNGASFDGQPMVMNWFIPLKGLVAQFKGDGATTASIASGSIYLFTIAAVAGAADCQLQGAVRLAYYDA